MSILITSDSTCDLGAQLTEAYDIRICPLVVVKGEQQFHDGVDINPDDIYAHVAAGGALCSTAALNVADYVEFFKKFSAEHDAVIHLNISSDFSSCYQNACIAAGEYANVYVVDSRNLSTGHGHMVLKAAEMAKSGMEPQAIVDTLNALASKVRASFVLDQLEYMKKGGRCSTVMALGANLLKLKPSIEVRDGKMGVAKKYRGSLEKCLREYVDDQLADIEKIRPDRIFVTHSGVDQGIIDTVVAQVQEKNYFQEITVTRAGCTVSCHCGPGTLGVLFIEK